MRKIGQAVIRPEQPDIKTDRTVKRKLRINNLGRIAARHDAASMQVSVSQTLLFSKEEALEMTCLLQERFICFQPCNLIRQFCRVEVRFVRRKRQGKDILRRECLHRRVIKTFTLFGAGAAMHAPQKPADFHGNRLTDVPGDECISQQMVTTQVFHDDNSVFRVKIVRCRSRTRSQPMVTLQGAKFISQALCRQRIRRP